MNFKNKAMISLAGLLVVSGFGSDCITNPKINFRDSRFNPHLREVAYTHDPAYYEAFKQIGGPKPNENLDGGDNCLNDPKYVKKHFWTVPSPHINEKGLTPWALHIERDIYDKSHVEKGDIKVHGVENGIVKRRVEFNDENPAYDPYMSEVGLEEYIRVDNNLARFNGVFGLGILVLNEGIFYRFYDKKGFTTYEKSELDSNPNVLNYGQKKLYYLVVLSNKDLEWIVNLRKSEGRLSYQPLEE
ncbi:MAG: hypothetical protein QXI33_03000 [Candidatus Pacearchaeota archaeon]